jgi:phosphoglycolate phosphatase
VDTSAGALGRILLRTCHLLIDFDGPVCSLFAGTPTAAIATRLRTTITREGVALPPAIKHTGNWFEIVAFAAITRPALASQVESELAALESAAAHTAAPTPGLADVLSACHDSGRQVAIVSNNSACAVRAYLDLHELTGQIGAVAARTGHDPAILKPSSYLIRQAASELGTVPSACALVGDSPSDIAAARSAQAPSIGYTATPEGTQQLLVAGADAIITTMAELAKGLREEHKPESPTHRHQPDARPAMTGCDSPDLLAALAELGRAMPPEPGAPGTANEPKTEPTGWGTVAAEQRAFPI